MKRLLFVSLGSVCLLACISSTKNIELQTFDRAPAFSLFKSQPLDEKDILEASSSGALKVSKARLLIDNDAAFDSKVEALRSAKAGETVRLTYYIYSEDDSSAIFTDELIKAGQRGVKIKLMADLITNYRHLDYFSYLQNANQRQYSSAPLWTPHPVVMIRDLQFMSQPCPVTGETKVTPSSCSNAKWKKLEGQEPDFFARLIMSGLYSRNVTALSTSVIQGQVIDMKAFTESSGSEEERQQFIEFLVLSYKAKVQQDVFAKLQVQLALIMYGGKLNPALDGITGKIPVDQPQVSSAKDWEHSTDFAHHKIIMIGNRFIQLGGRNIENSYHMKPNSLTSKYIFMDTDMAVNVTSGGEAVAASFDNLYNFSEMTISVDEVRAQFPNDFVENPEVAKAVVEKCKVTSYRTVADRYSLSQCIQKELPRHPQYQDLGLRMKAVETKMLEGIQAYNTQYLPKKSYSQSWKKAATYNDELSAKDVSSMYLTYVENVPYDKRKKVEDRHRVMGVTTGRELRSGKNIHYLWYKGLENTCAAALKENTQKRVVLHSAYFIPPALLLRAFVKMIDGTWDCRNVKVTFLTNSVDTTDLNYINLAAKYEMAAFFQTYSDIPRHYGSFAASRAAKFEYFEYLKNQRASGLSLHTKLTVLGDDVVIGSANADVRSYYMDTNNAFFVRNARDFTRDYLAYMDSLTQDKTKTVNLTAHYSNPGLTVGGQIKEDQNWLAARLAGTKFGKKIGPKNQAKLDRLVAEMGEFVDTTTRKILSKEYIETSVGDTEGKAEAKQRNEQQEMEAKFNQYLQVL